MPKKMPDPHDHLAVLKALVEAVDALDKCPFCGDNQDHHPSCIQAIALKSVKKG